MKSQKQLQLDINLTSRVNILFLTIQVEIPFLEIANSKIIGISSGASAPEELVQNLIKKIKKDYLVTIEEITVAEEKVVFKLPKELN